MKDYIEQLTHSIEVFKAVKDTGLWGMVMGLLFTIPFFIGRLYKSLMVKTDQEEKQLELDKKRFEFEQYKKKVIHENKAIQ